MSLCDTCHTPGNCCKKFALSHGVKQETLRQPNWKQLVTDRMILQGVPFFKPVERVIICQDTRKLADIIFTCTLLTEEGRCGDYENRPSACVDYQPKSDSLCVYYEGKADTPIWEVHKWERKKDNIKGRIPVAQI